MTRKQRQVVWSYLFTGASVVGAIGLSLFALRPNIAMGVANRVIETFGAENLFGGSPIDFDAVSLKRRLTPYGDLKHIPHSTEGEVALEVSEVPDEIPTTLYQTIANWKRLDTRMSLQKTAAPVPADMEHHMLVRARVEKPASKQAKTGWSEPVLVWVGPKPKS